MCTLILNAPSRANMASHCKSYSSILINQVGPDYAIYSDISNKIAYVRSFGHKVHIVLLCKNHKRRAEGSLNNILYTTTARNNVKRYDISICNLKTVPYISESLNRCGINFIPCI